MPTPQITITPAGFAAIVNAENTGTAPVKITQVGLTAQHFDVATVGAAVPNETKRLTTFGGKAIADDTLHLNVRDDGQDTYTLRGFGLYLEGGTLFAVYSQASPIMEKAAAATLLLATDIRFTNITATSIEVGDVDFINPPASTTQPGVVRLATEQEADAGSDHSTALTPRGLAGYNNRRFGAGAPSAFVKGLLSAATAAIFRVELGLKSAATRDEGHGNGLNADLLDGAHGDHYLDWRNFSNLPASFNPGPHSHPISGVDGLQDALNGKQPTGSYAAASHGHPEYVPNSGSDIKAATSYGNWEYITGNTKGRISFNYYGIEDYFSLSSNWKRTSPTAGRTDMVTHGTAEILLVPTNNQHGQVRLRTGGIDQAPQERMTIGGTEIAHYVPMNFGSSIKLKNQHPLEAMPYGIAEIVAIKTFAGHYNDDFQPGGRRRLFVIAEDVAKVIPEAVSMEAIEYNGELVPGLDDSQLVITLIRAVQQLKEEVDALKACR